MRSTENIGSAEIRITGKTVWLFDPSLMSAPVFKDYATEEDAIAAYDNTCEFAAKYHKTPRPAPGAEDRPDFIRTINLK